ncbi:antizyme inhibitor 2 isoform X3 [Hippopotamus amphibius kiboko]|uniref:antizyme inhibitor 2 isoform X3 n=1 Tax=Hippopotamus amphibius kiboko TaxID=575201 RepID=UPI002598BEBB|nr:antizyme inhibitor 2 isoform X3 [Hippopotamus amphibius kiboko]
MAGYLNETDFVMVEEGFSTRDLLEELTLGASQATTDEVSAFFVADLGAIVRKHFCFLKCLPRVRPFYAVKCNSSLGVLKVLAELGLGFSCANKAEMELVQHVGVPASKIIYANPCKQIAHIKYAAKHGVWLLSFDNEMELAKVVKSHPSAKFGALLKSCRHLLENAKRNHVEVVGVSFHIGSGCPDPQAYAQSIADARLVFEMGAELGHRMHILDLGGGFPGVEGAKVRFEEIASVISSALDLYFPEGCGVDILAKLGRYYVTSAFTLAVSIIAKKEVLLEQPGREEENGSAPKTIVYHLGEGVYGIFNSVLFDNTCPTPILQKKPSSEQPLYSSSLWGPVVDGCDCVAEGLWLPQLHGSPARAAAACRTGRGCRGHVQASVLWLGDHRHPVHGPRLHSGEHHVSRPRSPRRTPAGLQRCLWERWGRRQTGAPSGPDSGARSAAPHAPPVVFLPCK